MQVRLLLASCGRDHRELLTTLDNQRGSFGHAALREPGTQFTPGSGRVQRHAKGLERLESLTHVRFHPGVVVSSQGTHGSAQAKVLSME